MVLCLQIMQIPSFGHMFVRCIHDDAWSSSTFTFIPLCKYTTVQLHILLQMDTRLFPIFGGFFFFAIENKPVSIFILVYVFQGKIF